MRIAPAVSMAVAVHSHKGIYALLLGSGVSRAAGIPTGWEVIGDLIRRVAVAAGEDAGDDPGKWHRGKFGKEPNYSELLEMLAPTPAERTSLLKEYFEPTEEEREQGLKLPTDAHKAIARLVVGGYIRVIVTTNFDRLMERAIEAEGVSPTIVSTADQVEGMMPLPHVLCLVVKVHGDYLDTRLRNTPTELSQYPDGINGLLDRVFSEYGLIICGWSGDWDVALADAITRNTRFRFSTYWLARGGRLSQAAQDLAGRRQAVVVPIDAADKAFTELTARVEAIASHNLVDPTSPAIAIATMKRLLSEHKYRIQLHDFVLRELDRVRQAAGEKAMPIGAVQPNSQSYPDRMRRMAAACADLVPMIAVGVQWDDGSRDALWQRCLISLTQRPVVYGGHSRAWQALRCLPPTLVLYSAMASALQRRRFNLIRLLLIDTKVTVDERQNEPLIRYLGIATCVNFDLAQGLHEQEPDKTKRTPGGDWALECLAEMLMPVLGTDVVFENLFDEIEFLVALVSADVAGGPRVHRFMWRTGGVHERGELVIRTEAELNQLGDHASQHPLLAAGLFRGDADRLRKALEAVVAVTEQLPWM